jgi:hypothetical protein
MIRIATVMSVELISTLKRHALPTRRYTTGKTMNIYLDIDGVLLANEENLAIGAAEFIKYAADISMYIGSQLIAWTERPITL